MFGVGLAKKLVFAVELAKGLYTGKYTICIYFH